MTNKIIYNVFKFVEKLSEINDKKLFIYKTENYLDNFKIDYEKNLISIICNYKLNNEKLNDDKYKFNYKNYLKNDLIIKKVMNHTSWNDLRDL